MSAIAVTVTDAVILPPAAATNIAVAIALAVTI